ncbi:MAG: sulfatase [Planctomycetaceae bacterium]|nr:sulfatase [Planctomycetaceae bacterium]
MNTRLRSVWCILAVSVSLLLSSGSHAAERQNVLIITVDDMSSDSLGIFGCRLADTSPNIDALARQGMRFHRAHVVVGNCFPSRNVMWSGLYPHNTGVEGFYQVRDARHLHLADLMQQAGYYTGIQHKVSHSTPYSPYPSWDVVLDTDPEGKKRDIKAAQSYFDGAAQGIREATEAGKPFCLVMNVSDPHKPFYAQAGNGNTIPDANVPSRVFTPDEVPIPGFLFDDAVVRKELSHYYSSVRRADDCVGAILKALDESGQRGNTIILFLSDHGMPLPFAKTQVYHHSSHTPMFWIVPGVTTANTFDQTHLVSAVDLLPTLLEVTGIQHPGHMDGRSFAPLLKGQTQDDRHFVIKEYNENAGGSRDPMRSIQTEKYLYIFNPWSNGQRIMATATTGTPTYRRMAELAKTDPWINSRHELYQHRVPEELYDIQNDPDCLNNLLDSQGHQEPLNALRTRMEQWMVDTNDGMLDVFRRRDDPTAREAYVQAQEKEAEARRNGGKRRAGQDDENPPGARARTNRRQNRLIEFELPESPAAGETVTIRIRHTLKKAMGEQDITVTLKGGAAGKRLDRKVVKASGEGVVEVTFELPSEIPDDTISFAAFVGSDFQTSPQHIQSEPQALE